MKRTLSTTLMALLLCVCMVFGLTACGGFTQDDIDNAVNEATAPLNEQITALEADIADKEAKITTLETEKAALISEKEALEAEIAALETSNERLIAEKAALTAIVTQLEASIVAKEAEITSLNSSILALTAEKQSLIAAKAALEENNGKLEKETADLRSCLKGLHEFSYTVIGGSTHTVKCGVCDYTITDYHFFKENGKCSCGDSATSVSTPDGLLVALEQGGRIALMEDIELSSEDDSLEVASDLVLNLNGKSLIITADIIVMRNAILSIEGDGAVEAPDYNCIKVDGGTVNITGGKIYSEIVLKEDGSLDIAGGQIDKLTVEAGDCTVSGGYISYLNNTGNLTVKGGRIHELSYQISSTATIGGGEITNLIAYGGSSTVVGGQIGSFMQLYAGAIFEVIGGKYGFDPTEYVAAESHDVINVDIGIYSVRCKHNSRINAIAIDGGTHSFICGVCDARTTEFHAYDENGACLCGDSATPVGNFDELKVALAKGGKIALTDDIDVSLEAYGLDVVTDVALNLNGKTVTGGKTVFYVYSGAVLSVLGNGAIKNTSPDVGSAVKIHGGTVYIEYAGVEGGIWLARQGGDLNINGGLIDRVCIDVGNCTVSGGQIDSLTVEAGSCTVTGGEIVSMTVHDGVCNVTGGRFGFNVTEYVDTDTYKVVITDIGFYVTKKAL